MKSTPQVKEPPTVKATQSSKATALSNVLKPRATVFDRAQRDTVLDITDLKDGRVDGERFFSENYITQGMRQLYEVIFKRFEGLEDDGVFKLTEAMGGGKTHNMIAMGLLAKHPELRKHMADVYKTKVKGSVRIAAFSGRENAQHGVWGSIADQLGKFNVLADYYTPPKPPGQSEWIALLKGEPTLILLDELPPFFQQASTVQLGKGTLADIITTGLANLLVAVGKEELKNVAIVISDLSGSYQRGSGIVADVFSDFEKETRRMAKNFTPVQQNTDEVYQILTRRLFEEEPDPKIAKEVAQLYADELDKARKKDITGESDDALNKGIRESYPFHPSMRELYARFKENPGFMQTRGLIRLMRTVVARMWDKEHGWANRSLLIHPYDVDPNDPDTLARLTEINGTLTNAISNDIASNGQAAAEKFTADLGNDLPMNTARLLLMSSLSTVAGATKGLRESEIAARLAAPGVDLDTLRNKVLPELRERSWYLHSDNAGNFLYKNVQNVSAKVNSYRQNIGPERARQKIVELLSELFKPKVKDCYQRLFVLPAVDELEADRNQVALIIYQPHHSGSLHPDLQKFYDAQTFKNRFCFLTGDTQSMESINDQVKGILAVTAAIAELQQERVPANDPQMLEANDLLEKYQLRFHAAVQNIFVKLFFPTTQRLLDTNLSLRFEKNQYNGEDQVRKALEEKYKFKTDTTTDAFLKEAEAKLFGSTNRLPWSDVKDRAAMMPGWLWHHPNALDDLKQRQVKKDLWREEGNWINKGPFEQPPTSVSVQVIDRDDDTGKVRLRIAPSHGDRVHYQYGKGVKESCDVWDVQKPFVTDEMEVEFLCVDSTKQHKTGDKYLWTNSITLKHRFEPLGKEYLCTLQAAPQNAKIQYTTDGSEPLPEGGLYADPFVVKPGAIILAAATKGAHRSQVKTFHAPAAAGKDTSIDPLKAALWKSRLKRDSTSDSFLALGTLKKFKAECFGVQVGLIGGEEWATLEADDNKPFTAEKVEALMNFVQDELERKGELSLEVKRSRFSTGQALIDAAKELGITIKASDVEQ